MQRHVIDQISQSLEKMPLRRHQLLIVCEDFNESYVQATADTLQLPLINVNQLLSSKLKDLPAERRPHKVQSLLADAIKHVNSHVICLHHIEICFEPSLKQHPLRLFELLSRQHTLIVSWKGTYEKDELVYASPDHPEYVRAAVDAIVIQT